MERQVGHHAVPGLRRVLIGFQITHLIGNRLSSPKLFAFSIILLLRSIPSTLFAPCSAAYRQCQPYPQPRSSTSFPSSSGKQRLKLMPLSGSLQSASAPVHLPVGCKKIPRCHTRRSLIPSKNTSTDDPTSPHLPCKRNTKDSIKKAAARINSGTTGFLKSEASGIRTPDNLIKSQVLCQLS